jgi:glutathione synthase
VRDQKGDHFSLGDAARIDLATMDVVLMRQDPPFDMGYITATHMLEAIHPKTLVVNDPAQVRNAPEKLFVLKYRQFMPETLITRDPDEIAAFRKSHGDIILKPLYGNGGAGVFRLGEEDQNFTALLELFLQSFREPFIAQRYLPDVRKGDKRIILVDGKVAGAINRVPSATENRSNMHVGGRPEPSELTKREHEICEAMGPDLQKRGLIFVGIDVIGGCLTEINVTSPTGIREVKRFGGADIAALIWDAIEKRR